MGIAGKIVVGFIGLSAVGFGVWYYLQRKKSALAAGSINEGSLQVVEDNFCNPPVSAVSPVEKGQLIIQYQREIAMKEWERRGRGMSPDYFFEQYKKERGCP